MRKTKTKIKTRLMYKHRYGFHDTEIAVSFLLPDRFSEVKERTYIFKDQNDIDKLNPELKAGIYDKFGTLNYHKIFGLIGETA